MILIWLGQSFKGQLATSLSSETDTLSLVKFSNHIPICHSDQSKQWAPDICLVKLLPQNLNLIQRNEHFPPAVRCDNNNPQLARAAIQSWTEGIKQIQRYKTRGHQTKEDHEQSGGECSHLQFLRFLKILVFAIPGLVVLTRSMSSCSILRMYLQYIHLPL